MTDTRTQTDLPPLINVTILVYALQAVSFFLGITFRVCISYFFRLYSRRIIDFSNPHLYSYGICWPQCY